MLQFACPYCNGMFQVDPSMAGGEAMCPMCHGLVAVPVDAFGPPVGGEPAVESIEDYDFRPSKSRGMFEGLDGGGKPSRRFDGLADEWTGDAGPEADALLPMACPHCGSGFQVDGSLAGQQAMCPTCHGLVTIPDEYGPAAGFAPPAPGFPPPNIPPPNIPPPGQAHFGPLPPPTYTPPPSTPPAGFPPSVPMMPPNMPAPAPSKNPPAAPTSMNPLPPGLAGPATSPASTSALVTPLAPKPAQSSGVPLSALQPIGKQPETTQPPTSLTSPSSSTSSSPTSSSKSEKSKPGIEALLPTESQPAASRPAPLSPSKSTAADTPSKPLSRSAKIDALLPEQADPDEEVMAERPIAVEEPPEVGFPPLVVDPGARTPMTDTHGMPMRRPSADERARNYRIRTMLLFGLGMLLLILAAVVLPELGFVINVGDKPK